METKVNEQPRLNSPSYFKLYDYLNSTTPSDKVRLYINCISFNTYDSWQLVLNQNSLHGN